MSFLKKLLDTDYLKYFKYRLQDKIFISMSMSKLVNYHHGIAYDFEDKSLKQLSKILRYAYRNTSYYSKIIPNNPDNYKDPRSLLREIPFLDKNLIRENYSSLLAVDTTKDFVGHLTTGGSTGQPLGFNILGGHDYEHQEFLYRLMGYKEGDTILAMDGTKVPDELLKKNIFWIDKSSNNLPYGSKALSAHYLNNNTIKYYIEYLNALKPDIIRGYSSFIHEISKYINMNNINIEFKVKGIEITSESYYDHQLVDMRDAFGTKVYSQYGHAESSIFAYSTDESMISYCSPIYGFTEVIDKNGNHVNEGELGEVIVTGFFNYAMPFIRYRTGDLAIYDGTKDGIVKLSRVYGRTQDYIYTDNFDKILLTALVFGSHYKAFDNIDKWQIIQNEPGKIIFQITDSSKITIDDMNELKNSFLDVARIKTEFKFVKEISLTPRGKSKFLVQNLVMEEH